jgi:hypothetical protein
MMRLVVDRPQPGTYWTRLVRNGPRVPVMICVMAAVDPETNEPLDRSPTMLCLVAGEDRTADIMDIWTRCAGNQITADDYHLMMAQMSWAIEHAPDHPDANPRRPVDVRKTPPAF